MLNFFKKLFTSAHQEAVVVPQQILNPRVPDGVRVYVVGDIHGRLDLLNQIHEQIAAEVSELPKSQKKIVVYLGDYIDRGEESFGVVDLLINRPLTGCESVFLKGNHEMEMESFLESPRPNHVWAQYGGIATALSYQVRVKAQISAMDRMRSLRDQMVEMLPAEHQAFFANLQIFFEIGDYFMVHAGVRPGVPLLLQNPVEMLWIRDPFLNHTGPFEKRIVHGHTVTPQPITLPNRIGIDTGAYHSGRLTCLVLEGEESRFLTT